MARTNTKEKFTETTHEGALAHRTTAEQQLRRSVMACLLWEDTFYEDGVEISKRIEGLVSQLPAQVAADIAIEARTKQNLRHVPLWLLVAMIGQKYDAEGRSVIGRTIPQVVNRADEMGELLSMYWKDGKKPITRQMKIGLANAFKKFDEYQLAKYNRDAKVKIRDVMFLCHPKPDTPEQEALFKRVAANELKTPDTWEVALSGGADKKEAFTRLMAEGNLGAMAFIRNLRNMKEAGITKADIKAYAKRVKADKVLPFRFIAAARAVPDWSDAIEPMMLECLGKFDKLPGKTAIVVDNSGSMYGCKVSAKSDMDRSDAACALAILVREVCEDCVVIGFATDAKIMPSYRGFALADAIKQGPQGGTNTQTALKLAASEGYDRIIVITDEQSHQRIEAPKSSNAYFINVATYKNGIGYGKWKHIDGWSENVLQYIYQSESSD